MEERFGDHSINKIDSSSLLRPQLKALAETFLNFAELGDLEAELHQNIEQG